MEVDGEETADEETQDTEDNAVLIEDQNKENQSNGTKSRKRKRNEDTNPDGEDEENAPRKKQKVSHDDQHDDQHDDPPKLEITINDETIEIEAQKLQNFRHFDGKILPIDGNEENGFKFKSSKMSKLKDVQFTTGDLKALLDYVEEDDQNEVTELQFNEIEDLEGFVHCAQYFEITIGDETNPLELLVKWCRENEDSLDDEVIRNWKESESKILKDLHDELRGNKEEEQEDEQEEEEIPSKKTKSRRKRKRRPRDDIMAEAEHDTDTDGDEEKESQTKSDRNSNKKKKSRWKNPMDDVPSYLRISDEEDNTPLKKSKRLQNEKALLMTQDPAEMESSDIDEDVIKRLEDLDTMDQLESLQTTTIRRLCKKHNVPVFSKKYVISLFNCSFSVGHLYAISNVQ